MTCTLGMKNRDEYWLELIDIAKVS